MTEDQLERYRFAESINLMRDPLNQAAYHALRYSVNEAEHRKESAIEELEEVRELIDGVLEEVSE